MESLPIPEPSKPIRDGIENRVRRLVEITDSQETTRRALLDWLDVEYGIEKPSQKLLDPQALDSDALVAEVKKLRGKSRPLTASALKALRDEDGRTLTPARVLAVESRALERELSDLVNTAYGLTPEEVKLMWKTAPPRMPIKPQQ